MTEYDLGKVVGADGAKGDKGDKGATGNGISSITKTGTSGLIDTYTITYTNGNTTTFTVTNGKDGSAGTIDDTVTENSPNPVKSSGIYTALTGKANSTHSHSISDVTNLQTNLDAKVNTSDIANNLTTTSSGKVLDARQGKALADLIGDAITYINL